MEEKFRSQKGATLVLALLFLILFSLLGAALMSVATVETAIADNYKVNTQVLYVAEAGIDQARENLRGTANISTLLDNSDGGDSVLSTATDWAALSASNDVRYINNAVLTDLTGRTQGTYTVFIKNDAADGPSSIVDTNDTVTLLSFGRFRNAIKAVEVDVRRGAIPDFPAALTLDGHIPMPDDPGAPAPSFFPANSNPFHVDGRDGGVGGPNDKSAIGVITDDDDADVTGAIPTNRYDNYEGAGYVPDPPGPALGTPSINNVSATLAPELTTPAGLEMIVRDITSYATTVYNPGYPGSQSLGNIGSASSPQIVVVNGDCVFGPADGYGILVVRGNLTLNGNFHWNGLILVIGQGYVNWNGGGNERIEGAMLVARSRNTTRSMSEPVGQLLTSRGDIYFNFNGGGGNGIYYDTQALRNANRGLPFRRISYRLY